MAKFRLGGCGPDGRGLGWIRGVNGRRFNRSGEIYVTTDPSEIQALRRCPYVEEIIDDAATEEKGKIFAVNRKSERSYSRVDLGHKKMRELVRIGRGLYRVGMTKAELIDRIIAGD